MSKTKKFLLQGLLFCVIFVLTFFPIQGVFARKSLEKPWDMTNKISGFYHEPENEFSVMYFGSSHAYASFSPLEIWEQTGVKSYVFATQMQPMWASVTYLKEALKTQSPELVILECNMLYADEEYMSEGTNYSFMDDLPLSLNKVELAQVSAEEGGRFPLVFNFVKYHSRWPSLTSEDFTFRRSQTRDPYKGFVLLPPKEGGDPIDRFDLTGEIGTTPLSEKNEQYLREFIEICQENDIEVWLVKAPSNISPDDLSKMHAAAAIAEEYGVPFDDFNSEEAYEAIGITARENFFDQRHMDIVGSTRFSDYFAKLMLARYPNLTRDADDDTWQEANDAYTADVADAIANPVQGTTTTAAQDQAAS